MMLSFTVVSVVGGRINDSPFGRTSPKYVTTVSRLVFSFSKEFVMPEVQQTEPQTVL